MFLAVLLSLVLLFGHNQDSLCRSCHYHDFSRTRKRLNAYNLKPPSAWKPDVKIGIKISGWFFSLAELKMNRKVTLPLSREISRSKSRLFFRPTQPFLPSGSWDADKISPHGVPLWPSGQDNEDARLVTRPKLGYWSHQSLLGDWYNLGAD